jgi:hypothetical protein
MEHETTPFVAAEERSLVRDACIGILVGVAAFALLTLVIVRIGWPDQSWGFALAVAAFTAPWAGLFFGSAGGVAYSQLQASRAAASTAAPADTPVAPTVPPVALQP